VLTQYDKKLIFHILIAFLLVTIPLHFWPYHYGWIFHMNLLFYAILIECVRVSILAVRRKQKGAFILAVGALGFIINWSAFDIAFIFDAPLPSFYYTFTFSFGILSLPIATSVFLALEFAFTNRSLEAKVIEVQQLSDKTIAQEKEKQQILSSQNETLEKQVTERTTQVVAQKEELQSTVEHLKATQTQLIQSEKMASLGELTAGIAHEIQNPLNFVNNFSEVSTDLINELKEEIIRDHKEDALAITDDLTQNLEKIHHHGRRADSIVKSMLQHSRATSGEKQLTDINALADEYLRLAYHGLRAKEKDFNADLKLEADPAVGNIEVVPQEIGRVLLNLFNNAFYAVNQKKHQLNGQYKPQVLVTTKRLAGKIEIRVKDNGTGIPESVKQKIFQPFFTTKPTGEGTGLGLSLSYDIVKAYGGELQMETKEGEGTTFSFVLIV
jgi:signal transduction histidine kinase